MEECKHTRIFFILNEPQYHILGTRRMLHINKLVTN